MKHWFVAVAGAANVRVFHRSFGRVTLCSNGQERTRGRMSIDWVVMDRGRSRRRKRCCAATEMYRGVVSEVQGEGRERAGMHARARRRESLSSRKLGRVGKRQGRGAWMISTSNGTRETKKGNLAAVPEPWYVDRHIVLYSSTEQYQ